LQVFLMERGWLQQEQLRRMEVEARQKLEQEVEDARTAYWQAKAHAAEDPNDAEKQVTDRHHQLL
jgi:TPP-dependent pyruvate/acetoin dehydrogenase alpha subunit